MIGMGTFATHGPACQIHVAGLVLPMYATSYHADVEQVQHADRESGFFEQQPHQCLRTRGFGTGRKKGDQKRCE